MRKDIILSIIIGSLATYLPFWIWDSGLDRIVAAMAIGVIAFIALLATEDNYGQDNKAKP